MSHSTPFVMMLAGTFIALFASQALAAVKTQAVEYKDGDTVLEGYLAYDDALPGKRPAVLVVPEWWGLNDYAKGRARQLAEMGYVAFAVDMYGKGVLAKTAKEAGELAGKFRSDRAMMRTRIASALAELRKNDRVDPKRIAAIGYCFGGTAVLELARSGADIAGVVSFHGGLDNPKPDDAKNIKCKVLVLTGADDPSVSAEQVKAFQDEMRKAGVDWQMTFYSGARHGFTNPDNGNPPTGPVAYNEKADKRSWQAMKDFFAELFGETPTTAPAK